MFMKRLNIDFYKSGPNHILENSKFSNGAMEKT